MWPNPFTGIAGLYHVVARWTVRWNATVTDHLGPHHANGQASANAYVEGVRYLVHETTGTYLYPANSWSSTIHTANGTLVAKPSTSVSVFLNQTIRFVGPRFDCNLDLRVGRAVRRLDRWQHGERDPELDEGRGKHPVDVDVRT